MAGIFISYRRKDASPWARLVYQRLSEAFEAEQLFMDVDDIAPGLDFLRELERSVAESDVVLAIIGNGWAEAQNSRGQRRLDDPRDVVRIELEAALARDIRVIPVFVDGAEMPSPDELPEKMQPLAYRNGVELSHGRFNPDMEKLVSTLRPIVAASPRVASSAQTAPAEVGRAREPVQLSNLSPVARGVMLTAAGIGAFVSTLTATLLWLKVIAEPTPQPRQGFIVAGLGSAVAIALWYTFYRLFRDRPNH